jgi:hypothetical protein
MPTNGYGEAFLALPWRSISINVAPEATPSLSVEGDVAATGSLYCLHLHHTPRLDCFDERFGLFLCGSELVARR